ncbi:hypothetical protein [Nitrogeniibacter aestuarii]|uniref:hypothetical protein n=1 Tax=Nitrogeniibacter aestuarii TaxID=2815343 RepID=UPI001E605C95|nr:hypothetical protein [Nitrogeniibacter aestuarii]
MTSMADYIVLRDSPFTLEPGESKELSCFLPDDIANAKLIIAYKARALSSPPLGPGTTLSIRPGHMPGNIETIELNDGSVHGLWETFPVSLTSTLLKNIFVFTSEGGRMRISDVILWFQRNPDTPVRTSGG